MTVTFSRAFMDDCLEASSFLLNAFNNDSHIDLYSVQTDVPDLHLFTFNGIPVSSNKKYTFPPEIIEHLLSFSDEPLKLALVLITQINGVSEYLISNYHLYRYMTSALNHLNENRFLTVPMHNHPFTPFEFLIPVKESLPGVYFTVNPLWKKDYCFPLYFQEVFHPVIEYIKKILQGVIEPNFVKFAHQTSLIVDSKLNSNTWNDETMFKIPMTETLLQILFQDQYTLFQGDVIAPKVFLKQYLPSFIYELLYYFWDLKLPICVAGSAASYTKGIVRHFQDLDVFMTSDVLRRLAVCLDRHNLRNQNYSFHIKPRNGYDGETWRKLSSDDDETSFVLKTYELSITNFSSLIIFNIPPIQLIEQVGWNHVQGIDFTHDVLKRFDLAESQCALYNNQLIQRHNAPSTLQVLFCLKHLPQDHPALKRCKKYLHYILSPQH